MMENDLEKLSRTIHDVLRASNERETVQSFAFQSIAAAKRHFSVATTNTNPSSDRNSLHGIDIIPSPALPDDTYAIVYKNRWDLYKFGASAPYASIPMIDKEALGLTRLGKSVLTVTGEGFIYQGYKDRMIDVTPSNVHVGIDLAAGPDQTSWTCRKCGHRNMVDCGNDLACSTCLVPLGG